MVTEIFRPMALRRLQSFLHPIRMPSFTSGGKQIRLDHYAPALEGLRPAIILVHGSGGPLRRVDPIAQQAANLGAHVFVVHYFERTGHDWVYGATIEQHFPEWLDTLRDAYDHVLRQSEVDKNRVALLGFSLGAYLSVTLCAEDDRIAALVDLFGGIPEHILPDVKHLPPTLILHGEADTTVPVSEAYVLESVLKKLGVPYDIQIFPGQGHMFTGDAQSRAAAAIAGFLAKQFQLSGVGL